MSWVRTARCACSRRRAERHLGEPLRPFLAFYRELDHRRLAAVAATGLYGERLGTPALGGLPEEIAQELAAAWLYPDGPLNVVRVGGGGYSVLTRDAGGRVGYEANERCSAGTGETVEGLCARLGRSLDEAVELARQSADGVTVTSRCAVFAKSELTHFANQGESHARIFSGLFAGVARNVHSLYDKSKVDGPVLLVGHGALIAPIAQGLAGLSEAPVTVAAEAGVFEALGALRHAATAAGAAGAPGPGSFPADPGELVRPARSRVARLAPAREGPGSVVRLADPVEPQPGTEAPAVLGLDLGSTGSKAVLLERASGAVLASVYRRTEGNPVEAAQALVAEVVEMLPNPVIAVGVTGSGRDAAATVFRAAYPDIGSRLTVQNEIVAHASAAARLDPDGGRSLSIVEIGGQDAKFINVEGGRVVDADMNRVCSAGTGSFLEEQALAHGVEDIAEFGRLAARSDGPPDLGQTCTVFVADVAAEALGDGYSHEDIFAGLQYSVVRNYRSRVMGQRRLLGRVFFQGKPASDPALARTLAAVLEREVYVPADPGAMGAVGIALLAGDALAAGNGSAPRPLDLARVLEARVAGRREFQCKDRDCLNLCRLELAEIDVAGTREKVVSGGQCPKYDAVSAPGDKLPKDAPNPYRERRELLRALLAEEPQSAAPTTLSVALPCAHYLIDTLPFFHTLLRRLGCRVDVLRARPRDARRGRPPLRRSRRLRAGQAAPRPRRDGLRRVLRAALRAPAAAQRRRRHVHVPDGAGRAGHGGARPCRRRVATRACCARSSSRRKARASSRAARGGRCGARPRRSRWPPGHGAASRPNASGRPTRPLWRASAASRKGCATSAGAPSPGRASTATRWCSSPARRTSSTTTCWTPASTSSWPPTALCPCRWTATRCPTRVPGMRRVHWASAGQTLRAAAAGAQAGDVFPLLLGAYGCGPNSMVEHLFADLVEGYPHAVLESDGHGGKAGYVTRVQAFLHSVRAWRAEEAGALAPARLARFDRPLPHSLDGGYDRYFFGHVGGGLGEHLAAAMRGAGFDAAFVGEPDAAALRAAGAACSGKECLPYQLIWGSFARFLADEAPHLDGRRALFLSAGNGFQACRANLFPFTEQVSLEKLGLGDTVEVADFSLVTGNLRMMPVVWIALVAVDLLNMMRFYHLAAEKERGVVGRAVPPVLGAARGACSRSRDRMPAPPATWPRPGASAPRWRRCSARPPCDTASSPRSPRAPPDCATSTSAATSTCASTSGATTTCSASSPTTACGPSSSPTAGSSSCCSCGRSRTASGSPSCRRSARRCSPCATSSTACWPRCAGSTPGPSGTTCATVDRESRRLVAPYPFGETIPAVGGALLTWRTQPVDGVVSVAPRGCGPALIAEAQLRREAGLPALFVYNDGDPIDEARLAGFAWRLRSRPARRAHA